MDSVRWGKSFKVWRLGGLVKAFENSPPYHEVIRSLSDSTTLIGTAIRQGS